MQGRFVQYAKTLSVTAVFVMAGWLIACQTSLAETQPCDGGPVLVVISGVTKDAERMMAYSKALKESGLYPSLEAYYLNSARPIRVFEGEIPDDFVTLIVRFPSVCAAEAFWNSDVYQENIRPLRLNPSAGDYTVTVYPEADIPEYMIGKSYPGSK